MSTTEAVSNALKELIGEGSKIQKRRRIENALLNLADEDVCKHIDKMLGAGAADLARLGMRNLLARRAGGGDDNDGTDSGVTK